MSNRKPAAAALLLALAAVSTSANAGVYGDTLGKCLVSKSTEADRGKLVEWIFAAIALNPAVASYADIPADKRLQIQKNMAGLFERLVGESCRAEATEALKYEGAGSFAVAFELLGKVAGQQVFASPEVAKGTQEFLTHLDIADLQKKLEIEPGKK